MPKQGWLSLRATVHSTPSIWTSTHASWHLVSIQVLTQRYVHVEGCSSVCSSTWLPHDAGAVSLCSAKPWKCTVGACNLFIFPSSSVLCCRDKMPQAGWFIMNKCLLPYRLWVLGSPCSLGNTKGLPTIPFHWRERTARKNMTGPKHFHSYLLFCNNNTNPPMRSEPSWPWCLPLGPTSKHLYWVLYFQHSITFLSYERWRHIQTIMSS